MVGLKGFVDGALHNLSRNLQAGIGGSRANAPDLNYLVLLCSAHGLSHDLPILKQSRPPS